MCQAGQQAVPGVPAALPAPEAAHGGDQRRAEGRLHQVHAQALAHGPAGGLMAGCRSLSGMCAWGSLECHLAIVPTTHLYLMSFVYAS